MFKTCPYCHKIVPANHRCELRKQARNKINQRYAHGNEYKRFIWSQAWRDARAYVLRRDGGVDQAALNGLDNDHPYPYIQTRGLQVHHIIKYEDRPDLATDPDNLITLSTSTHKQAEDGEISADDLRKIAQENGYVKCKTYT